MDCSSPHRTPVEFGALVTNQGSVYILPARGFRRRPPEITNVVFIDLVRDGEDTKELFVGHREAALGAATQGAVVKWAASTGYARVWFTDGVIDLSDRIAPLAAQVACPTCGTQHHEGGMAFMAMVLDHGAFPNRCTVCTGLLPEWTPIYTNSGEAIA
jgi:hypothetical protein